MAWLEKHPTSGRFKLCFRIGTQKYKRTLKAGSVSEAETAKSRLEETLDLVERGRLEIPPDADLLTFLFSDGKRSATIHDHKPSVRLTLSELSSRYLEIVANGAFEATTLVTIRIHLNHLRKTLGERVVIQQLTHDLLQSHIDRRLRENQHRERNVSPAKLKKEIASFRACWNWAVQSGKVTGVFPSRGLMYPAL